MICSMYLSAEDAKQCFVPFPVQWCAALHGVAGVEMWVNALGRFCTIGRSLFSFGSVVFSREYTVPALIVAPVRHKCRVCLVFLLGI